MTPKERVLKEHPTAYLFKWTDCRLGYSVKCASYPGQIIAAGTTPSVAWKRAADRIVSPQRASE